MIKIIDRTLAQFKDSEHLEKDMLEEMCRLLVQVGVDEVELSIPIARKLGKLPEEGHFWLEIEDSADLAKYPGFEGYVYKGKYIENLPDEVIHEVEVNEIEEVEKLEGELKAGKVRLTGLGALMHKEYTEKMKKVINRYGKQLDFCPTDSSYCATALGVEWLMNGGRSLSVSFNGIGGYAKLEEVLMSIKVIMHKKSNMDLRVMPRISLLYEKLTQSHIHYNKAIVGKNIFNVEAGVQISKDKKKELGYEPYDPTVVGKVRRLVIGKHSGSSAIKLKLQEKGVRVTEEVVDQLVQDVKVISMNKGRSLTDKEFLHLVKEVTCHEA